MDDATANFVNAMIENSKKKKEKLAAQSRTNADPKEVEKFLEKVQREIQQTK